ncbi:Alpha-ketoglutarate-dependent dioxygenase AlkB [Spatholobus suberectus]|nr:Alpha-ketoglutarate-dependent dioxygenase AlkB [Spatholobus suberectus]
MFASRPIPLTWSFHPSRITPIRCHLFLQFSSRLLASNQMGKIVNSSTESSPAQPLSAVTDSAVRKDPMQIMDDGPLADTSHDNEGFIMFGSIPVLVGNSVKNYSLPRSPSCTPVADKHPELMSSSNHLASPPTTTTAFEHTKFKRRSRIDLGLAQASGHNCSVPSSNFEDSGLPLTKKFSTANLTTPHDESPQGSHSWKKKPASVNRPYNSPTSNSNYAPDGHKLDASVSTPMFKSFDICFHGRRNPTLIGAPVPGENKESSFEMQEGGTKEGILRPGMVLLKNYITHDEQVEIVKVCRELGLGPGGFYQPGYASGAKLRLKMMCLGMDWDPQTYKYGKKRVIDGSKPPSIPKHFSELVIRAIQDAHSLIKKEYRVWNVEDVLPSMTPDICIVNFYTNNGKLGLHQDRDESRESLRKGLPVVSFSVGDSAEFLYGDQRDIEKAESVLLESGDVLIFGGESRHVFHGVSSVLPNSAQRNC